MKNVHTIALSIIVLLLAASFSLYAASTGISTRTVTPPATTKPAATPPAIQTPASVPAAPAAAGGPNRPVQIAPAFKNMGKISGSITGSAGGKSVPQWFGKCENIRIDLLNDAQAVVQSLTAVPSADGCRFEAVVNLPRSLKLRAPAASGNTEFSWQYYQSWTGADINNTTNIVLKDAGPRKLQMAASPPDLKIRWLKNYPVHPSDIDTPDVTVTVGNLGGLPGTKKVYYKCIPLTTATCGTDQKVAGVKSIDIEVPAGGQVEKRIFGWNSPVLLFRLQPGEYEIVAGWNQGLNDSTAVHKKFKVSKLPLTLYETYPRTIIASPEPYKYIYVYGSKFTPQSVILMQAGSAPRVTVETLVSAGTNQTSPTSLTAKLQNGIGDKPGTYYFWVKNPNGELSNSVELVVKPAYTGPPVVNDYYPRVIKKWDFDPYNNRVHFPLPMLLGEGLDGKDIKTTAAVVESSASVGQLTIENMKLTMPGYNYLKKGVIELTVYRGDPSNGTKLRLPVDTEIPVVGAPTVVLPAENEIFLSKDVTLRVDPPAGTSSRKFRLRWEWEPPWSFSFHEINVVDSVDMTNAGTQGIKISKGLFPGEGSYRVRARVAETEGVATANDWSNNVTFKIVQH